MNIHKTLTATLALALLLTAAQLQAFGGGLAIGMSRMNDDGSLAEALNVSFTAKATLETEEVNIEETMYYRPGKLREEMQMAGQNMAIIQRHDLGKMWMVMPQGMYMEHPIDDPGEQAKSFELIEHEQVGSEVVNGMQTTKYKTIWQTDDGRFGGFSWVTEDGIAVKAFLVSETNGDKQRIRFQITELTRTEQPQSLFEVPDGYTKLDMSSGRGLSGLMGGGAGNSGRPQGRPQGYPQGQQRSNPEGAASPVEEAARAAEEAAKSETSNQINRKVREGIRGLFNRD